jgi:iron complex outermembrane receptor protein
MFRSWILTGLVGLAAACAVATPLSAQTRSDAATVSGRVTLAADGSPVHGATVIVVGARRTTTTDDAGVFTIENVPIGTYEVVAQREHLSADRQTVTLTAGGSASLTFVLTIAALHENVAVTGSASGTATTFDSFSSVTSLDSFELALTRGASVAEALAGQAGISIRSFGPGNARPIIRGFDGDRVLIMQDGVRTGDLSSQSGDHGTSIDPAGLERIEVVKGPATLLYGSNAIGGVVNAITPQDAFRASPFDGGIGGVSFDTGSNNGQLGGSGNVQYGRGPWTVWAGGGARRTGDYESPDGVVANSSTDLRNGKVGVGWTGQRLFVGVGAQLERSRFGVPFASELHGHEGHGEDEHDEEEGEEEELDIDLLSNRRDLRIDTGLRNLGNRFLDNVKVVFAATSYDHDELEVSGAAETVGTQFSNSTRSARVELEQKRMGRLSGRMGVEWFGRDYEAVGEEALSPRTRQQSVSAFVYEELDYGRSRVQFGARVERNAYRPDDRPESSHDHEEHEGEEHEGDEHEEHEAPEVRDRSFTGLSASVGLHRDLSDTSAFVVNLTTASRAPALEELYNFGPHVGNLAFEIGNPDLDTERTVGIDVSLRRRADRVSGELNLFAYNISNFVFMDFTGDEADGLREIEFAQADSRFIGAEATGEIGLGAGAHLDLSLSTVRARLTEADENLPRVPPLSARVRLELPWRQLTFSPEMVLTAAQRRVFRDETETAGFALVNMGVSYFIGRGHATHAISLSGRNLTNTAYRQHTSFLKDFAPEMGRSVKVTYTARFF